ISGECSTTFYKIKNSITDSGPNVINLTYTLRMPQELEWAFALFVILQLLFLVLFYYLTKKFEAIRIETEHRIQSQIVKDQFEAAEKMKNLAAQVSHDIRSPLAALEHTVESLKSCGE